MRNKSCGSVESGVMMPSIAFKRPLNVRRFKPESNQIKDLFYVCVIEKEKLFDGFERFLVYLNLNEVIFVGYLYLYLPMKTSMQMQHLHLQATKLTCLGLVTAFLPVLNQ